MRRIVLLFVLVLLPASALAQRTVTARLNTATLPDTTQTSSLIEIRGALDSVAPTVLPDGNVIDWNANSTLEPTNQGGDYWDVTFQIPDDAELQFRFYSQQAEDVGISGWEDSNNNHVINAGTDDVDLGLHFFDKGKGSNQPYDWQPFESKQDSVGVWFRVYMNTKAAVSRGYDRDGTMLVAVRGDNLDQDGEGGEAPIGPLDWGTTQRTLDRESTDDEKPGYDLYSGVAYYPARAAGLTQNYKFVFQLPDESVGWEDDFPTSSGNRVFTVPPSDTTLHWVYFSDSPPPGPADPITSNVIFSVDVSPLEQIGLFSAAAGDAVQVRGAFNGWTDTNPDISRLVPVPGESIYENVIPLSTVPGSVFPYKFYIDFDREAFVNRFGVEPPSGWEDPASTGRANRTFTFEGSVGTDQDLGVVYFNDIRPEHVIPEGSAIQLIFSVDMTAPVSDNGRPFDPAADSVFVDLQQDALWTFTQDNVDTGQPQSLYLEDDNGDLVYTGALTVSTPTYSAVKYKYGYGTAVRGYANEQGTSGALRVRHIKPYADGSWPRYAALPVDAFMLDGELPVEDGDVAPQVLVSDLNAIPQDQIAELEAKGSNLTIAEIESLVFDQDVLNREVELTVVILSDPLNSGLSGVSGGRVNRIHVFARDIAGASGEMSGMGVEFVDGDYETTGLLGMAVGDVVRVRATVQAFGTNLQLSPIQIERLGTYETVGLPEEIIAPVAVVPEAVNVRTEDGVQVNWSRLPELRGQYIQLNDVMVVERDISINRPNWIVGSTADGALVQILDTSLRYRNDRSSYPAPFNVRPEPFTPPEVGQRVRVNGFVSLPDSFDPFGVGAPALLGIHPMEDEDVLYLDESGTTFDISVTESETQSTSLTLGFDPAATNGFDTGLDMLAPPTPPSGTFDARLRNGADDYTRDIRPESEEQPTVWTVAGQSSTGSAMLKVAWDPEQLPQQGTIRLQDTIDQSLLDVDMRAQSSYAWNESMGALQVVYAPLETASRSLASGWNLMGLPVSVADSTYTTVFPNAVLNTFFAFDGGYAVPSPAEFAPGEGYWLRFEEGGDVSVSGKSMRRLSVDVETGWNLISGPNCELPYTAIEDPGSVLLDGTLFGFAGAYVQADALRPMQGYWIRAGAAGSVTFDCAAASKRSAPPALLSDLGEIVLEDAKGREQRLYFGSAVRDVAEDAYTLPPVSPVRAFRAAFERERYATGRTSGVTLADADYPISLRVTRLPNRGKGFRLAIGPETVVLSPGLIQQISAGETVELQAEAEELPTHYALEQNYPNPFNPSTTFRFAVPESSTASLAVYDLMGRRVATLLENTRLNTGWHTVSFDARGLASGVYVYRFRAGTFTATRTLTVLK